MDENLRSFIWRLVKIFCIALFCSILVEVVELHAILLYKQDACILLISLLIKIIIYLIAFGILIKEVMKLFKQEVFYDMMTGLYSRRKLFQDLNKLICAQKEFTICYIDFNNFKYVNDTYGHGAGDILLKEFSKRINLLKCERISCYRIGGDEFVILIKRDYNVSPCISCIKRLSEKEVQINKTTKVEMDFAIGTASNDFISTADELLKKADANMYKDKRA